VLYSRATFSQPGTYLTKSLLPSKQDRHIGIDRANNSPDVHPVPQRERLARDMREDHLPNHVRKLQTPGAEERDKCGRVDDIRVAQSRVIQPCNVH
jgi:hypothetical protein